MPDIPIMHAFPLRQNQAAHPPRRQKGRDRAGSQAEDFSIFVGNLVPTVGRPVAIVTYERDGSLAADRRRETATYWAFFTHEDDSLSSALCQRMYVQGAYPRVGAKGMIDRGRDEASLALSQWATDWLAKQGRENVQVDPLDMQVTDVKTLFGLYVFRAEVRGCVQECLSSLNNERLRDKIGGWDAEVGINKVSLHAATTEA